MIPANDDPMAEAPEWARSVLEMDHTGGDKLSQYSAPIGQEICRRVAAGMTIRQIAADPDMPSYATVFHWLKIHPDFAEPYGEVRKAVAAARLAARAASDVRRAAEAKAARRGPVPRDWGAGRRSGYSLALADRFCRAIADGGTLKTVTARAGMPSVKQVYSWLRQHPAFREIYAQARAEQRFVLELRRDAVIMGATPQTLSGAKRRVAWLEGRIGRLTPKVYRARL